MAKKRGVDRDQWQVFLQEVSRHGSIRKACRIAGVTRCEFRAKFKEDPDFASLYGDAEEDSVDRLHEVAQTTAMSGDTQMLKYMLDNRRYKKADVDNVGDVQPVVNITIGVPDETLQEE